MELYYSKKIGEGDCIIEGDEALHCVRVMRNKIGDIVDVIDGRGISYECRIDSISGKNIVCSILSSTRGLGAHPYRLTMAVALTKNMERYEWYVEKATELGTDRFVPLVGDFSIRKDFNRDRLERIMISAVKQSLKAFVPKLDGITKTRDFIAENPSGNTARLICCCNDNYPRQFITEAVEKTEEIIIMIGPEGDFSRAETDAAVSAGFGCVTLGEARLRTETAAVLAVSAVSLTH
ncbi:MAG: 16S rRNA (uracil(1498)-N(3))-methyltransferase [Bacteroidales bacterium]|jgi:16S rRNA (uracil1498-N3)-methyltransferase|nr:16S rRNA (uracil(1498)-N(3))-methyltransferase [Bacteroidales bacterium]MCI2145087.1 16S rRNA (uracil(1498)-N(3))-methyltransferase [Bacteroidales bacterium]